MGKLTFENRKFYFESVASHSEEMSLAKDAGLRWDESTLRWVTRQPRKAVMLRRFADKCAEKNINILLHRISHRSPEQIIYPDHLAPHTWQIESAFHALTRSPCYIADEAGLGKTVTAALCINTVPGKTLIICPPFLKYNWAKELTKWCLCEPLVIEDGKASSSRSFEGPIIILPDSLVSNPVIRMHLSQHKFEWLIVDEAHRFKTAAAKRTESLVGGENL